MEEEKRTCEVGRKRRGSELRWKRSWVILQAEGGAGLFQLESLGVIFLADLSGSGA